MQDVYDGRIWFFRTAVGSYQGLLSVYAVICCVIVHFVCVWLLLDYWITHMNMLLDNIDWKERIFFPRFIKYHTHTLLQKENIKNWGVQLILERLAVVQGLFMKSLAVMHGVCVTKVTTLLPHILNPYPTAFPYGNGMVLHLYQQQENSTTKTVHKVINKGLKAYV